MTLISHLHAKPLSLRSDAWLVREGKRLRHRVLYCRQAIGDAAWREEAATLRHLREEWASRHPPAQRDMLSP